VLSLPIYPGLAMEQADRVAGEIRSFYEDIPAPRGEGDPR
jgi:dTDP-4-amino-4,6-dideoxygalactose transaminase